MKKIMTLMLCIILVLGVSGCKKSEETDPNKNLKDELVKFINEDIPSIQNDRDAAVNLYNSYFTSENTNAEEFASQLETTAIPKLEKFLSNIDAISLTQDRVIALRDELKNASTKQLEAIKLVVQAIKENNPDLLTTADTLITESKNIIADYEKQLKQLSEELEIEISGEFSIEEDSTTQIPIDDSADDLSEDVSTEAEY